MIKVTFYYDSALLKRRFINVEIHRNEDDARLRALALGWQIRHTEPHVSTEIAVDNSGVHMVE